MKADSGMRCAGRSTVLSKEEAMGVFVFNCKVLIWYIGMHAGLFGFGWSAAFTGNRGRFLA